MTDDPDAWVRCQVLDPVEGAYRSEERYGKVTHQYVPCGAPVLKGKEQAHLDAAHPGVRVGTFIPYEKAWATDNEELDWPMTPQIQDAIDAVGMNKKNWIYNTDTNLCMKHKRPAILFTYGRMMKQLPARAIDWFHRKWSPVARMLAEGVPLGDIAIETNLPMDKLYEKRKQLGFKSEVHPTRERIRMLLEDRPMRTMEIAAVLTHITDRSILRMLHRMEEEGEVSRDGGYPRNVGGFWRLR